VQRHDRGTHRQAGETQSARNLTMEMQDVVRAGSVLDLYGPAQDGSTTARLRARREISTLEAVSVNLRKSVDVGLSSSARVRKHVQDTLGSGQSYTPLCA
jgi:hypothetical protein